MLVFDFEVTILFNDHLSINRAGSKSPDYLQGSFFDFSITQELKNPSQLCQGFLLDTLTL